MQPTHENAAKVYLRNRRLSKAPVGFAYAPVKVAPTSDEILAICENHPWNDTTKVSKTYHLNGLCVTHEILDLPVPSSFITALDCGGAWRTHRSV